MVFNVFLDSIDTLLPVVEVLHRGFSMILPKNVKKIQHLISQREKKHMFISADVKNIFANIQYFMVIKYP